MELVRTAADEYGIDEHGVHAILLCPWHQCVVGRSHKLC
jgi:hypothetical protein